jgi:hypothetical protein
LSFYGGEQSGHGPGKSDPPTQYEECNRSGNRRSEIKLDFISTNGGAAEKVAVAIQFALGPVSIDIDHLAATLLAWSMNESGYGEGSNFLFTHNYFGNNARNSEYSVTCPAGALAGAACYSSDFSFGDQLTFALSTVAAPTEGNGGNPNHLTYGQSLEAALASNPNLTTAQIMNVIGQTVGTQTRTTGTK